MACEKNDEYIRKKMLASGGSFFTFYERKLV
jgi:hypothetical protein